MTLGKLLMLFSRKVNLLYLLNSMPRRCYLLDLIKQKFSLNLFFKNCNPNNSGTFSPVFPSRSNLKLHSIPITPKLVKVITCLNSSKASQLYSNGVSEELSA